MMPENPYAPPETPVLREPRANRRHEQHLFANLSDKELKSLITQGRNLRALDFILGLSLIVNLGIFLLIASEEGEEGVKVMLLVTTFWLAITLYHLRKRSNLGWMFGIATFGFVAVSGMFSLDEPFEPWKSLIWGGIGLSIYTGSRSFFKPDAPKLKALKAERKRRQKTT